MGGRPTPRWPEWLRLHWAASLGAQRPEVAPTIKTEGDRLAVDERALDGEASDRVGGWTTSGSVTGIGWLGS